MHTDVLKDQSKAAKLAAKLGSKASSKAIESTPIFACEVSLVIEGSILGIIIMGRDAGIRVATYVQWLLGETLRNIALLHVCEPIARRLC